MKFITLLGKEVTSAYLLAALVAIVGLVLCRTSTCKGLRGATAAVLGSGLGRRSQL